MMYGKRQTQCKRLFLSVLLLPLSVAALPPVKNGNPLIMPFGSKDTGWISDTRTSLVSATHYKTKRFRPSTITSFLASNKDNGNFGEATTWMTRKNFFAAIGTFLISSSILLELYSRAGSFFISDDDNNKLIPPLSHTQKHATIVFHGSGGQDDYTDRLMQRLRKNNLNEYNEIVEWSKYSTNIFQASYNGERIGKLVAKELLSNKNARALKTIHLIGISVGSFGAEAAARELKERLDAFNDEESRERPFLQLTLLDPFTQRGIFGVGYGNKVFGTSADYAVQYLNTDDPVPSTNAPLQNAVCYDITNLRPEEVFGHDWPVAFYGNSEECGKVMVSKERQAAVGSVIRL